jgi:hypothetical protein
MDQESCESQCSTTVSDVLRLSRDKTVSDVLGSDNYQLKSKDKPLDCSLFTLVEQPSNPREEQFP